MASNGEHPGEAMLDEYLRLDIHSHRPMELDSPLVVFGLLEDLFRSAQLLVASHMRNGGAEVFRGKGGESHRMETFRLGLGGELQTNRRILAYLSDRAPKCEEFFRVDQDAGLIEEVLRKPGSAQDCRDTDSLFFHPRSETAGTRKCLIMLLLRFERSHVDGEAVLHIRLE